MSQIITQLDMSLPEKELTGITEDAFWRYLIWQEDKKEVTKRIRKEFERGAFYFTGYDDDNRPPEDTETPLPIGKEMEFLIHTILTTKRPSYSSVNEEFGNYLDFLSEQHQSGILRKGIRTIDGQCYVLANDLMNKLNTDLKTLLEGRDGVRQKLEFVRPEELLKDIPRKVSMVFGRDYSALTDYNGRLYVATGNFIEDGDRKTGTFKKLLLEDSLQTLGEIPEDVVALSYPFENMVFRHQLEPRATPKHKDVVYAFINPGPKRRTKKSKIGDLIKIKMIKEQGLEDELRSKGLVDDDLINDYKPETRDGKTYVLLEGYDETSSEAGVKKRLKSYRENLVTAGLEQNISLRPMKY